VIDIIDQLNRIHREVGGTEPNGHTVALRRTYDTTIEDLWDACTDPERISRWFLPVSGDLRLGGTYQLKGNAGGEILRCEAPRLLRVSWVFGEFPTSEVELRLSPGDDGGTTLHLEHIAGVDPDKWATYGPGAVGVGWDLGLLGLGLHLSGGGVAKPDGWDQSPAAVEFVTRSSDAWGVAYEASGAATEDVTSAVRQTTAAYTGMPAT
jgi:uncharacterized protein YndB with AHSA1/START domain